MAVTVEAVQAALSSFVDPNTQKDYVSTRALKNLKIEDGQVSFDVELGYPAKTQLETIRAALVEITDYLDCVMVKKDGCESDFNAKERKRRDSNRKSLKLD